MKYRKLNENEIFHDLESADDEHFKCLDSESRLSLYRTTCLNEMARINLHENGRGKYNLNSDVYDVYVQGEADRCDLPHFHIKHRSEGWNVRIRPDGTFHSFKTRGKGMNTPEDAAHIEKITKQWVLQRNTFIPQLTNGKLAKYEWDLCNTY